MNYKDFTDAKVSEQRDTLLVSYRKFLDGLFIVCLIIAVLSSLLSAYSIGSQIVNQVTSIDITCLIFTIIFYLLSFHIGNRMIKLEYLAEELYGEDIFETSSFSDYLADTNE